MNKEEIKELLKELLKDAFEAGRDYGNDELEISTEGYYTAFEAWFDEYQWVLNQKEQIDE
jgi:hypothetical protein